MKYFILLTLLTSFFINIGLSQAAIGVFRNQNKVNVTCSNHEFLDVRLDFNVEVNDYDLERIKRFEGVESACKVERYGVRVWVGKAFDRREVINNLLQKLGKKELSKRSWKKNTIYNPQFANG